MKGYFADVFAGLAPVGRRLLLEGANVHIWELGLGAAGDICNVKNLKLLLHDIRLGAVRGVMLQPPCDTMSAIRNIDRRGPLRTRARPYGDEWAERDERLWPKVLAGNACAKAAATIARACMKAGVPFVVENPRASWLWKLPCWEGIVGDARTTLCCCDQCMFGALWRKRTGLLCFGVPDEELLKLQSRCNGSRGVCDKSGKQHILLIGTDGHGTCWTKRAQSYPLCMAKAIAAVLLHSTRTELLIRADGKFCRRV